MDTGVIILSVTLLIWLLICLPSVLKRKHHHSTPTAEQIYYAIKHEND